MFFQNSDQFTNKKRPLINFYAKYSCRFSRGFKNKVLVVILSIASAIKNYNVLINNESFDLLKVICESFQSCYVLTNKENL